MLVLRRANPEINVRCDYWNSLQDRRRHPRNQEGNFFLAERMKEPTEWRAAWCRRHRSSGVAARNRAHNTLSSPSTPLT